MQQRPSWLLNMFFHNRTTRECARRWRRSSGRGRSWSGSSGGSWRTWTTPPGTRPTSEIVSAGLFLLLWQLKWSLRTAAGICPISQLRLMKPLSWYTGQKNNNKKTLSAEMILLLFKNSDQILTQYCTFHSRKQSFITWTFALQKKHLKRQKLLDRSNQHFYFYYYYYFCFPLFLKIMANSGFLTKPLQYELAPKV